MISKVINILYMILVVSLVNINHITSGESLMDSHLIFVNDNRKNKKAKPELSIAERINSIPDSDFEICGGVKNFNIDLPDASNSRIAGGNENVGVLHAQRQNENYITVGNSVSQESYKMIPETNLNPTKSENYTSLYSFKRAEQNIKHSAKYLKPLKIVFNRLVFDIDCEDNLGSALISARNVVKFFNDNFPELYIETYFSGNKGYHIYVFFEEIEVDNPQKIVKHITKVLKDNYGASHIDLAITDIFSRKFRAAASRHSKTGLYKVPVDLNDSTKKHLETAKNNIANIPVEKYNQSESFNNFILQIDEQVGSMNESITEFGRVIINNTLHDTFGKYFIEGQMNTLGWRLIHCFKRANTKKEDVIEFFSSFKCNHVEVNKWIDRVYDTKIDRLGGLNALRKGLEEVGAKPRDIQIICGYFQSNVAGEEALNNVIYCLGERKRVDFGRSQLANFLSSLGINGRFGMDVYYRKTKNTGWCKIDDSDVYKIINPKIGFKLSSQDLTGAKDYLNDMPEPNYDIIQFNNGQYNIATHTFNPVSDSNVFSLVRVPYDYNPKAKSKLCKHFLKTSLPNYSFDELFEVFGYYFTQGNAEQIITFLTGVGGAGKNVLTKIFDGIFKDQTCSVEISLYNERFQRTPFVEAHINLIGEADTTVKHLARNYKEYTGNTPIQVEIKNQDPFTLSAEEIPKAIQVCNNIPDIDFDTPTIERFIVIEFKTGFRNSPDKIPDLDKKILADHEEVEWFIYNSLEAWKNFDGQFKIKKSIEETENQVIRNNNPLIAFVEECTEFIESEDGEIVRADPVIVSDFESRAKEFCQKNGYNLETTKTGKLKRKQVKEAFETVYNQDFFTDRTRHLGKRAYVYINLYWREE